MAESVTRDLQQVPGTAALQANTFNIAIVCNGLSLTREIDLFGMWLRHNGKAGARIVSLTSAKQDLSLMLAVENRCPLPQRPKVCVPLHH